MVLKVDVRNKKKGTGPRAGGRLWQAGEQYLLIGAVAVLQRAERSPVRGW